MKKQLLFIHGGDEFVDDASFEEYLKTTKVKPFSYGSPVRWKDSLDTDLGDGWEVMRPTMPNKYNAQYSHWKIWFERHIEYMRDGIVLVGHSLGAMFLLRYLSENTLPITISKLILVAPMYAGGDDVARGLQFYVQEEDKFSEINENIDQVIFIASHDDFVVPYSATVLFREKMSMAEWIEFEDRGHFLQEEFPELIELIKR